ncbi:MAG: hypothetical protein JW881_07470 [Spirochaetales bacterium]|nr:hypothetical protein [Spirochaetales bacterium]
MNEKTLWGIHAGRYGEADQLFLKKNYIALGWKAMNDLSRIENNRDAFKKTVAKTYPDEKRGAISVHAGLLYRFVHEMNIGDIIIYPSKMDRLVHLCEVKSDYKYNPSIHDNYPNLREVVWLKKIERTKFSQGALFEIGAAITLFQV